MSEHRAGTIARRFTAKARLIAHADSTGICQIRPEIPLGTVYLVDPLSVRKLSWAHPVSRPGEEVIHDSIYAARNEFGPEGWMVLEMLELEKN